jgi:hypothetical protein
MIINNLTDEQSRTLAIVDGFILAHKDLEISNPDLQIKKEEMKVVQALSRLKERLKESYKY